MSSSKSPDPFVLFQEEHLSMKFVEGRRSRSAQEHHSGWNFTPFFSIVQVQSGEFFCEYEGGERVTVKNERALFVLPNQKFNWGMLPPEGMIRWGHIDVKIYELVDVFACVELPKTINSKYGRRLGDCIERSHLLRQSLFKKGFVDIVSSKRLQYEMLEIILSHAKLNAFGKRILSTPRKFIPLLKHIHENLGTIQSRDELARVMNLSPTRFHDVFKEGIGIAPMQYIKKLKLQRAQELLCEPGHSIKSVAAKLGFFDAFHFSKQFSTAFGISPSDFQKNMSALGIKALSA